MEKQEFSHIRRQLGKSQKQMAQLLGTSLKAIQSFEQGWRNIPVYIERLVLFMLAMKMHAQPGIDPCWVIQKCPQTVKEKCPAWEFGGGHFCWFINGTICHGEAQKGWNEKKELCQTCKVFQSVFPLPNDTQGNHQARHRKIGVI